MKEYQFDTSSVGSGEKALKKVLKDSSHEARIVHDLNKFGVSGVVKLQCVVLLGILGEISAHTELPDNLLNTATLGLIMEYEVRAGMDTWLGPGLTACGACVP